MANNDIFSSLISDIKNYSGKDPLIPWLRGIRRMRDSLPSDTLKEKLPRFLQKCTMTFESDRRYRDDLRYLRVWLQLMDYVDNPRELLRAMEEKGIGTTRSLFYQAYALYYEKHKKFDKAEKMYHLGVMRLAEPVDELHKAYDQFLPRMKRHNNKKIQQSKRSLSSRSISPNRHETEKKDEDICGVGISAKGTLQKKYLSKTIQDYGNADTRKDDETSLDVKALIEPTMFCGDDTVVRKFGDTAIYGKSEAEAPSHHGLVEPTINMMEAMNAINSMFCMPLETLTVSRRSHNKYPRSDHILNNGFKVFLDEDLPNKAKLSKHEDERKFPLQQHCRAETCQPQLLPLKIFVDYETSPDVDEINDEDNFEDSDNRKVGSTSASHTNGFIFPHPKDFSSENSDEADAQDSNLSKFREDTVVCRFVGSAISKEAEVENMCHHGLVEPTINLKEAMDDINNMFGKPIEFVRTRRSKKQENPPEKKNDFVSFSILPDDDFEYAQVQKPEKSLRKSKESDLFEPTIFMKEAMDEINMMFKMPLD